MTEVEREFSEQRKKILDEENDARMQANIEMLSSAGQMFGSLGDIIGSFAGKSSGAYKAMFAVSKGFSIASSTLSLYTTIGKAMETGFPQNIPLMAQAAAQGASLISSIKGTNISGQAHDGIDYIPREGTWLLDKGERVVDSRTNSDLKNFLNTGSNSNSEGWSINVINNSGAQIETSVNDDERIINIAVNRAIQQVSSQLSTGTGSVARSLRDRWRTNMRAD